MKREGCAECGGRVGLGGNQSYQLIVRDRSQIYCSARCLSARADEERRQEHEYDVSWIMFKPFGMTKQNQDEFETMSRRDAASRAIDLSDADAASDALRPAIENSDIHMIAAIRETAVSRGWEAIAETADTWRAQHLQRVDGH